MAGAGEALTASQGPSSRTTAAATAPASGAGGGGGGGAGEGHCGAWHTQDGQLVEAATSAASQLAAQRSPAQAAGAPTAALTASVVAPPGAMARPGLMHLRKIKRPWSGPDNHVQALLCLVGLHSQHF